VTTREHVTDQGVKIGEVWLRLDGFGYWAAYHDATNTRVPGDHADKEQATAALRAVHAEHAAKLAREAAMPAGARFTLAMRRRFRIGPRTRRHRDGTYLRNEILRAIQEETHYPVDTPDSAAIRVGYYAFLIWSKNIDNDRYSARLSLLLSNPTPWDMVGLLADMIDAGVVHEGHSRDSFLRSTRWHRFADTRHCDLPGGPLEGHSGHASAPAATPRVSAATSRSARLENRPQRETPGGA
jgi:hypothetical protein